MISMTVIPRPISRFSAYRLRPSIFLSPRFSPETQWAADQGGPSWLRDGGHRSAPRSPGRKYERGFLFPEDPRPRGHNLVSPDVYRTHMTRGSGFHTSSPTLQVSTECPHGMLRITSGARYCNGMAFPQCSLPIRAWPKSQMVSGPAPPKRY